jgi:hypothetical protein
MKKHKTTKTLLVIAIIALITAATYAFTASNNVQSSKAGDGSGTISGYSVTNIHYTNLGTSFATVSFDLDAAASNVTVSFDGGASTTDCGASAGSAPFAVSCSVGDAIGPASQLEVISVS